MQELRSQPESCLEKFLRGSYAHLASLSRAALISSALRLFMSMFTQEATGLQW